MHGSARREDLSAPGVVPAVDGFRGYSALLVVLFHCWLFVNPPLDGGPLRALVAASFLGVDYFFVISGFVLFLPIVRRGGTFGSVKAYAVRRVGRIVPAYYLNLAGLVLAYPLFTGFSIPLASLGGTITLLIHLLFLQYAVPAWLGRLLNWSGMGFGINGVLWSLTIEMIFYCVLPLAAARYARHPLLGLAAAIITALGWRALVLHLPSIGSVVGMARVASGPNLHLLTQFPGFLGHFGLGMTAAWLFVEAHRGGTRSPGWKVGAVAAQVISLAALLGAMWAVGRSEAEQSVWHLLWVRGLAPALAFAGLLTATVLASERAQWLCANRLARWLGDVSYGVYLWHVVLIGLVTRALGAVNTGRNTTFAELLLLVVPMSLLAGWLSRRLVEEPAIRYARTRARRW